MSRSIPACPTAPSSKSESYGVIQETYTIELVTPLFGGGVEAGCNDPDTLIRPTSVRGHLRFWWRATRGARLESISELRKQEGRIWGTTENPSKVVVEIVKEKDLQQNSGRWDPKDRTLPLRSISLKRETEVCKGTFEIKVSWPKSASEPNKEDCVDVDVKAAMWGWINFGGLGARSRRGCGSLYCDSFSPEPGTDIQQWYASKLNEFGIPAGVPSRDWPTLPGRLLITKRNSGCIEAWNTSVSLMQKFRQLPGVGRNPGSGGRPGRSRWPEPESIREISREQQGLRERPYGQKRRQEHMPVHYFPRAEFGMPIIFEIRNENLKPTLQPAVDVSRMASPLILKPLAVSKDQAYPMILCLRTKPLRKAVLLGKELRKTHSVDDADIRNACLVRYDDSPMTARSEQGSAIQAFISFAKEEKQGFVEVGI